jgi:hypothetical protein
MAMSKEDKLRRYVISLVELSGRLTLLFLVGYGLHCLYSNDDEDVEDEAPKREQPVSDN